MSDNSKRKPDSISGLGFGEQSAAGGGLRRYRDIVVGPDSGWGHLVLQELLTTCLGPLPGLLGLGLRRLFYPLLFAEVGRGCTLGVNLSLRQPSRISLGRGILVDDGCQLSVRGGTGVAISLEDGVFAGRHSVLTTRCGTIHVGERTSISACCRIASTSRVTIGRLVQIAAFTYIGGGDHRIDRVDVPIIEQGFESRGGVEIEDDVWIGAGVVVHDGVYIGNGAVIGAGSVVTKDIPPYAVALGAPARVVRDRRDSAAIHSS
jgi:acetyltransferase-like isoleucine patch superfamily enzyme